MTPKRQILCVDDDDEACGIVSVLLPGYEVHSANSMAEGLGAAAGRGYKLFLIDYRLPDGDGAELCRLIREFDQTTPILIMSATAEIGPTILDTIQAQGFIHKQELVAKLLPTVKSFF